MVLFQVEKRSVRMCPLRTIFIFPIIFVGTSESPDRDCCEPLYPFISTKSPNPANNNNSNITEEVTILNCIDSRQLCSEDPFCNQILQIIPLLCGVEIVTCSTDTRRKCLTALSMLRKTSYFSQNCLCKHPNIQPECNQVHSIVFKHPCMDEDLSPNSLPTCLHSKQACDNSNQCTQIYKKLYNTCILYKGGCYNSQECQLMLRKMKDNALFGCLCPLNKKFQICTKIQNIVHKNPCMENDIIHRYGEKNRFDNIIVWKTFNAHLSSILSQISNALTTSYSFQTISQQFVDVPIATSVYVKPVTNGPSLPIEAIYKSTCHIVLQKCKKMTTCRRFLDQVKRTCETKSGCDRQNCMKSIQEMYKEIPNNIALDIAFCLCKNTPSPDEQCLAAQAIFHPACAQNPSKRMERIDGELPACHIVAEQCRKDYYCRSKLIAYEKACSVDSTRRTCSGSSDLCRQSMINILGTELRTTCACNGFAADFRELYKCIGWHRLLWVNPCVVKAQKEYHAKKETSRDPIITISSTRATFKNIITTQTTSHWYTTEVTKRTTVIEKIKKKKTTTEYIPRTTYNLYTTPAWPNIIITKKNIIISTTTSTTTTTLPPKFCLLEKPGQPVKYIREGYKKRLYKYDDPDCSELCECHMGKKLTCKVLKCIAKDACNTGVAFYSHASPFYRAHRGQCLCYSGAFVCSKPPKESDLVLPDGVFLFLGYSSKDEELLKKITGEGVMETIGSIQGLVSYHNINGNKSDCRMFMHMRTSENIVLQALMDEHQENRDLQNITAEILNREKEECFDALKSISRKINTNDADMRSHVILSMIKVSAAVADIPPVSSQSHREFITFDLYLHIIFLNLYSCINKQYS